jgi:protein-disulfide isomerase
MGWFGRIGVVIGVLALGACGGDLTLPLAGAATTPDTPGFTPFNQSPEAALGLREVIKNPSVAEVMKTGELPEMSWGRPDAPVTIIKYASLTCPYCRRFQAETFPQLKREYIDTGKVRFIIREFPIGKASGTATVALRCTTPENYLILYDKFLALQPSWVAQEVKTDAIFAVASQVGTTRSEFDSCLQNRGMIASLNWVKERGRTLGVIGTPNFFVNGRLVKSVVGMKEIREMVDQALAGKGPASNG